MKHYKSYFENEQECIKAILEIHNGGNDIDCDPMYFKGNFYKNGLNKPKYRFDLNPQNGTDCVQADATNLPLDNMSIDSIMLDPPFLFGVHGKTKNYYSAKTHTIFKDWTELENCYKGILTNAYRVLKRNGLLIFKCQDYTDSKTTMTHCYVWQWATELGFYAKDLAILNIPKSKVYNGNLKQKHLRKVHTYFWVFEKKGTK